MIGTFVCPSAPEPLGGVTALYEFANGLARRGHEIHIAHGAFWGRTGVSSVEEIGWFRFEPSIHHHFGDGRIPLPPADVIFGTDAEPELGLPVLVVQGFDMFPEAVERAVFRTPCLKVCVAGWLVDAGASYGSPQEQLVHVPMGIDHDRFRITRPRGTRGPVVGILHNTHQAKGWVPGIAALEEVHDRHTEVRVVAFGVEEPPGPLPPWMEFVHDPEPDVLVRNVYNRCRVFLQPSYWEGFGFTAVEAMACGAALVSTDNGGSRDYALHDRTALVAPAGDVRRLAEHVERLLFDTGLRQRLTEAGLAHIRRFQWDRAAAELEHHLLRYLEDPRAFQRPPADDEDRAGADPSTG